MIYFYRFCENCPFIQFENSHSPSSVDEPIGAIESDSEHVNELERDFESTENGSVFKIEPKRMLRPRKEAKRKSYYVKKTKQFECFMCLFICNTMYELKGHLNIFHPVKKKELLTCPHCPKTTISREVLSRHLKKASENTFQDKI